MSERVIYEKEIWNGRAPETWEGFDRRYVLVQDRWVNYLVDIGGVIARELTLMHSGGGDISCGIAEVVRVLRVEQSEDGQKCFRVEDVDNIILRERLGDKAFWEI